MKLVILNRYFHPDESATSRMVSSLAFGLAERSANIHAVSSRQLLGSPGARLNPLEEIDGVKVHRLWTSRFGRRNIFGRIIDYLTYYLSALLWLIRYTRRDDVLIVATDPPLLSVVAAVASLITGARRVNWLHDLYPEVAAGFGILMPKIAYRLLQRLRDWSLREAAMNVAIGDRMAAYVRCRSVRPELISVIHNWSDAQSIQPVAPDLNIFRKEWGLAGKFVVGYSGNMGRGHDFDTVMSAARALENQEDIVFLFIGAGHQHLWIEEQARVLNLHNVMFKPYQSPFQLSASLSVPDVHLVTLKPALECFMVPSKFYGIAAAGRPSLFIGDIAGEIPAILGRAECGTSVAVGHVAGLVECILQLQQSPLQAARWARNARDVLLHRFDRRHAIGSWRSILDRLAEPSVAGFS